MRVINVIVHSENEGLISIDSFGIYEVQLSNDVVKKAEICFTDKCVDLKFGVEVETNERDIYRDEVSEQIEDGYITINENTVTIVWSDI